MNNKFNAFYLKLTVKNNDQNFLLKDTSAEPGVMKDEYEAAKIGDYRTNDIDRDA